MPFQWPWKPGAKTVRVADCETPCFYCSGATYFAAHCDSEGKVEMMILKCPKCGEIKKLYRDRPQFEMTLKLAKKLAE